MWVNSVNFYKCRKTTNFVVVVSFFDWSNYSWMKKARVTVSSLGKFFCHSISNCEYGLNANN